MSKRFLKWAEAWIDENVLPGANSDVESYEAMTEQLLDKMFAEAAAANFSNLETKGERERFAPRVLAVVSDRTDFDIDTYVLKTQLAREHEDGD